MFRLPLFTHPQPSREPFSRQTLAKTSRLRGAAVTESVCPYCAVGCGQLIYTKAGKVIDIEGNPDSPINEGTLCPKGADAFQLAVNPHRITHVLYRAPFSDHWERKPLDWALDQIARRVQEARDADFTARNEKGQRLSSVRGIGTLGGATLDVVIDYVLTTERWFREYVLAYTNASAIIQEGFQDTEDLGGLFSGYDPKTHHYNARNGHWGYQGSSDDASPEPAETMVKDAHG